MTTISFVYLKVTPFRPLENCSPWCTFVLLKNVFYKRSIDVLHVVLIAIAKYSMFKHYYINCIVKYTVSRYGRLSGSEDCLV